MPFQVPQTSCEARKVVRSPEELLTGNRQTQDALCPAREPHPIIEAYAGQPYTVGR